MSRHIAHSTRDGGHRFGGFLDGIERVIRARSAFFVDAEGKRKLIGANWDVTEEVKLRNDLQNAKNLAEARNQELEAAKESIEHLALHDYLTGLPNRRYLDRTLEERAEECRNGSLTLAVLHIDLDRFKQINDTLGHRAGDAMLKHAAKVLKDCVRSTDFEIQGVPDGDWVVMAVGEHSTGPSQSRFSTAMQPYSVRVRDGRAEQLKIAMRAPLATDPPIAITLAAPSSPYGNRLAVPRPGGLRAVA